MSYAWKQAHRVFTIDQAAGLRNAWCKSWPEHAAYFDLAKRVTNNGRVAGERPFCNCQGETRTGALMY